MRLATQLCLALWLRIDVAVHSLTHTTALRIKGLINFLTKRTVTWVGSYEQYKKRVIPSTLLYPSVINNTNINVHII